MVKKRNVLKEPKKKTTKTKKTKVLDDSKTPESGNVVDNETVTPLPGVAKSRKKTSIEDEKDRVNKKQQDYRDRNKEKSVEQSERETKELLLAVETFCCMPFDLLAKQNAIWILTPKERNAFTLSSKALLDKYAGFVAGYSIEVSFCLISCSILIPRLLTNDKKEQVVSASGEKRNGKDIPGQKENRIQDKSPSV